MQNRIVLTALISISILATGCTNQKVANSQVQSTNSEQSIPKTNNPKEVIPVKLRIMF